MVAFATRHFTPKPVLKTFMSIKVMEEDSHGLHWLSVSIANDRVNRDRRLMRNKHPLNHYRVVELIRLPSPVVGEGT